MATKAMFLAMAVGAGLVGCQSMDGGSRFPPPPDAPTQPCPGAICEVDVTVVAECAIRVIDVVDVRGGPPTQVVHWNLRTPGYTFSNDPVRWGIVIKDGNASGQFHDGSHQPTRITLNFKHRVPPSHKDHVYGINVVRTADGQHCSTKDPWFVE